MASRISRKVCTLGRPGALGTGRWGSIQDHSASDKSVWYALLMLGTLPSHLLQAPFRTVSPRTRVNSVAGLIIHRGQVECAAGGRVRRFWCVSPRGCYSSQRVGGTDLAINPGTHRRTWGGSKSGPWKARNPVGIGLRYAKLRVFLPTSLPLCVAHLMARFGGRTQPPALCPSEHILSEGGRTMCSLS